MCIRDRGYAHGLSFYRECLQFFKGFHGDVLTLTKMIGVRMKMYEHEHGKKMSTKAIAAMLSTMLYYRCVGVLVSLFIMLSYIYCRPS